MPYTARDSPGSHSKDALPAPLPRPRRPRIRPSSRNGNSGSVPGSPSTDQGRRQGFLTDRIPWILPLPALLKPKVPSRREREKDRVSFGKDGFFLLFLFLKLFFLRRMEGFLDGMQFFFLLWRHGGDRDTPTALDCGEGLCHILMDPGKSPEGADRRDGCKLIQCKCLP